MEWKIPGSTLTCVREEAPMLQTRFESMFLGGDLSLSQVVVITGLEAHTIQNWVKRGFLTPPVNKHYSLRQLCRLLNMHMLRGSMPLDKICALLSYVNGRLNDVSDDIIDDTVLYFLFVRLAAKADTLIRSTDREQILREEMACYNPPREEDRQKVQKVLEIMLTAYLAAYMQQQTEQLLHTLL